MNVYFYSLLIVAASSLVVYILLRAVIKKYFKTKAGMKTIRDEVNDLIRELNATTERNIVLIEERIAVLKKESNEADKKILLLHKEQKKTEKGADVYSSIIKKRMTRENSVKQQKESTGAVPSKSTNRENPPRPPKEPGLKEKVRNMIENGLSREDIAKRTGTTISEIELILSILYGRDIEK